MIIEFHGSEQTTDSCIDAITRLVSYGERIEDVKLLSCEQTHCFLIRICEEHYITVKSGFRSGYGGEGSKGLATVLMLLKLVADDVNECVVSRKVISKIDNNSLKENDLLKIQNLSPVRPTSWRNYIYDIHGINPDKYAAIYRTYPTVLPLRIIDDRIMDLALKFEDNPDVALMDGYRRLEDKIRSKTGITGASSTKLFSLAFNGKDTSLSWAGLEGSEQIGRSQLFSAVFMAYRNRRAHKVNEDTLEASVREFFLLNELFVLEKESSILENTN